MKIMKKMHCPDTGLLLLRVGVAAIFISHGISKFQNMESTIGFFGMLGLSSVFAYIVAAVELVGGIAVLLGVFARYAGIALSIVMIFAIILVKSDMGFNAAEIDIMLLVSSLAIAFGGPGKYSLMRHVCGCGCKSCHSGGCDCSKDGVCNCGCGTCGTSKCDGCEDCKKGGVCTGHEMK